MNIEFHVHDTTYLTILVGFQIYCQAYAFLFFSLILLQLLYPTESEVRMLHEKRK